MRSTPVARAPGSSGAGGLRPTTRTGRSVEAPVGPGTGSATQVVRTVMEQRDHRRWWRPVPAGASPARVHPVPRGTGCVGGGSSVARAPRSREDFGPKATRGLAAPGSANLSHPVGTFVPVRHDDLLGGLDPAQREAVTDDAAPLCILAGAGSGKTRVLPRRIAWRVARASADPGHVLALTF